MKNYRTLSIALAGILLVIATAGATGYLINKSPAPEKTAASRQVVHTERTVVAQPVAQQRVCDDGNIAGKAVGGVGGGVLGSMIGKGNGKTAATIGGTLGGAYIGGETIPLRNATCR